MLNIYAILIILISISAAFAYINKRFLKMPFVIGLFFLSTVFSLIVLSSKLWFPQPFTDLKSLVEQADISKFILNIVLGLLLFAGSIHVNWPDVRQQLTQITLLALGGVIMSAIIVASIFYGISNLLNLNIDFIYCLLFGALISPTDPIAVLAILTKAHVPKKIETTIVAESLFNDGIGVVMFIALLETLNSGSGIFNFYNFGLLFLQEAVGGIIFGLILGFTLLKLIKSIDHYETEVLLTLAFVMLGYYIANLLKLSGPLAMVIMGLFVGNYNKHLTMSSTTREYVHKFWELVDVILNSILFILIALVMVVINFKAQYIFIGILSIFIVLISRIIVVYTPLMILPKIINYNKKGANLLIWGGLRGGLSLAMVLSLPDSEPKHLLLIAAYFCVLFSILVQGLTIGKLAKSYSE
jgi:monovalent cation:H+ antiporter, CPA1 family